MKKAYLEELRKRGRWDDGEDNIAAFPVKKRGRKDLLRQDLNHTMAVITRLKKAFLADVWYWSSRVAARQPRNTHPGAKWLVQMASDNPQFIVNGLVLSGVIGAIDGLEDETGSDDEQFNADDSRLLLKAYRFVRCAYRAHSLTLLHARESELSSFNRTLMISDTDFVRYSGLFSLVKYFRSIRPLPQVVKI